jgi:hypothetical protein
MPSKDSTEDWVRKGPVPAMAVVTAIALVIGALIGVGAGFKIEQKRTKDDVKRLQQELKASASAGQVTGSGPLGQRIGQVTAVKPDSITVATRKVGSQEIKTTTATRIDKVVKGSIANIVAGRRVLVATGGREIIVLSPQSKMGRVVSRVATDFFTIARANGSTAARLKMTDVKVVSTVKPATSADIKSGVEIVAGGREGTGKVFNAVEVVLLPAHSGFAN